MPDLALRDQLLTVPCDVLDWHVRIDAVLVKKVDGLDAEALIEPSTAWRMRSGLLLTPRFSRVLGSMSKPNLVAITTWSRIGRSASPTTSSLVKGP